MSQEKKHGAWNGFEAEDGTNFIIEITDEDVQIRWTWEMGDDEETNSLDMKVVDLQRLVNAARGALRLARKAELPPFDHPSNENI